MTREEYLKAKKAARKLPDPVQEKKEVRKRQAAQEQENIPAPLVPPVKLLNNHNQLSTTPMRIGEARNHLAKAFDLIGGVPALVTWGKKNPTEFYRLWSRLIPKESHVGISAMSLEDLLGKLATQGDAGATVQEAADAIGMEVLARAGEVVEAEFKVVGEKGTLQ